MIKAIDFSTLKNSSPYKEFIMQDWLAIGSLSSFFGERGTNKSFLVQELMTAIATGQQWSGTSFLPAKVYGVFSEYDETELLCRQYKINKSCEISNLDRMKMISLFGKENLLMTFNNNNVGTLTPLFNELLSDIKSFKPKLVVLDKALDLFGGDENNNSHVRQFIHRCCAYIAREVNSSVLLCKHGSIGEVWRNTIEFHIHAYLDEKSNYLEKKNNVHVEILPQKTLFAGKL